VTLFFILFIFNFFIIYVASAVIVVESTVIVVESTVTLCDAPALIVN